MPSSEQRVPRVARFGGQLRHMPVHVIGPMEEYNAIITLIADVNCSGIVLYTSTIQTRSSKMLSNDIAYYSAPLRSLVSSAIIHGFGVKTNGGGGGGGGC